MFDLEFTLTKRQLGLLAIAGGILAIILVFVYDNLGASDPNAEFGPSQKMGLVLAIWMTFIGITLLPLGNRPA